MSSRHAAVLPDTEPVRPAALPNIVGSTDRPVLLRAAACALVCAIVAATSLAAQATAPRGFTDAHVHLNDPEAWVMLMNEMGVDRSIALAGRSVTNAQLREAGARWPGRILPFVSVSPEHREFRAAWVADDARLERLVDSLLTHGGFHGIGEISVTHFPGAGFPEADFAPDGLTMRGLLGLARKHGVPIMVHVEVTRLRELDRTLAEFPDVTVIWAHGGYTPLFLARRMLDTHPNLVYELSARTWARHPRSPDYTIFQDDERVWQEWLDLIEQMPTRFIVGTDAAGRSPTSDREKIRSVELLLNQLSVDTRRQVAHANLERLLGPGS